MSAEPVHFITPEEYLVLERAAGTKSEYFDGQMYAMAGASFRHNRIIVNLVSRLNAMLLGGPCQATTQDQRVRVSPSGLYAYPDIVVVCGEPQFVDDQQDTLINPSLLVEVLSPSTEAYDRGFKFQQYRSVESLQQYVLVSQDEPVVEVYTRQEGGAWMLREWRSPGAVVELPSIGCEVAVADIYAGLDPAV